VLGKGRGVVRWVEKVSEMGSVGEGKGGGSRREMNYGACPGWPREDSSESESMADPLQSL
jgi:hypothetical protein